MAIYDYKCTKCGKIFVIEKAMGERDPETCQDIDKYQKDKVQEISQLNIIEQSNCKFNAPVVRVIESPDVDYRQELEGKDLDYRVRKHYEEVTEAMKQDKKTGISIDLGDIEGNFE